MDFGSNEVIDTKQSPSWAKLQSEIEALGSNGSQWVFRALREPVDTTSSGRRVAITSSFDDACKRRSGGMPPRNRWLYESWMLSDFKREAHNYLSHLPEPGNFLEWMALGRHYGMPSRLIDFTYSFHVATYFALSMKMEKGDGCIVALNLTWMKENWERRLRTSYSRFKGHALGSFHSHKLFRYFAFVRHDKYAVIVNPLRRNPRLANQMGCFLCPGSIQHEADANLAQTLKNNPNVKKLIYLRSPVKREAMIALFGMNISQATLYPDLVGWAESRRDLVHREIADSRFRKELAVAIRTPRI